MTKAVRAHAKVTHPRLWSPGFIFGISFFLGFPSGMVLLAMNMARLGRRKDAKVLLVCGVIILTIVLSPTGIGNLARLLSPLAAFGLRYIANRMKPLAKSQHTPEAASIRQGLLIGLGVLLAWVTPFLIVNYIALAGSR